jgi:hypothetical protein
MNELVYKGWELQTLVSDEDKKKPPTKRNTLYYAVKGWDENKGRTDMTEGYGTLDELMREIDRREGDA